MGVYVGAAIGAVVGVSAGGVGVSVGASVGASIGAAIAAAVGTSEESFDEACLIEAQRTIIMLDELQEAVEKTFVASSTSSGVSSGVALAHQALVSVSELRQQLELRKQALAERKERKREHEKKLRQARDDMTKIAALIEEDKKRQAAELKEMQARYLQELSLIHI